MDSIGNKEFGSRKIEKVMRLEQVKIGKIFGILKTIFEHQNDYLIVYRLYIL